jgi:nitric-oxide synthase
MSDHHSESHRFIQHVASEERAGRRTPADWSWIVPPLSGSTTPVFHRYYYEADLKPNFYLDADAAQLAHCGRPAVPQSTWDIPEAPPDCAVTSRHSGIFRQFLTRAS